MAASELLLLLSGGLRLYGLRGICDDVIKQAIYSHVTKGYRVINIFIYCVFILITGKKATLLILKQQSLFDRNLRTCMVNSTLARAVTLPIIAFQKIHNMSSFYCGNKKPQQAFTTDVLKSTAKTKMPVL